MDGPDDRELAAAVRAARHEQDRSGVLCQHHEVSKRELGGGGGGHQRGINLPVCGEGDGSVSGLIMWTVLCSPHICKNLIRIISVQVSLLWIRTLITG